VVTVDEAYLRESILNPAAKITAGFQPIMPTFQGLVNEEQLLQLVDFVLQDVWGLNRESGLRSRSAAPTAMTRSAAPARSASVGGTAERRVHRAREAGGRR